MRVSFQSLEPSRLSPARADAYAARGRHEVAIAVGRSTVAVRFSRSSAAAIFADRFSDMPGKDKPAMIVYAVALEDEAFFWLSPDRARRWPQKIDDELMVFFADNLAMHEYLGASADLGLHAAVVADGTVIAALVGDSTAGKTTTAIAATRAGFALYSDERCIIQDRLVVPFLRAITVREGGRLALLSDPVIGSAINDRLREMPAHHDAAIRPSVLLGDRAGGPPGRLGAVFVIEGRDVTPTVIPCSLYAVLPALLRSMASSDTGLARPARLADELRGLPIYALRLGSPDATVGLMKRTLHEANRSNE